MDAQLYSLAQSVSSSVLCTVAQEAARARAEEEQRQLALRLHRQVC